MAVSALATAVGLELETARVSVTAGVGGGELIPAQSSSVDITSANSAHQVSLPAARVGDVIRLSVGANGCDLVSSVAAHKANNVTIGATNALALAANCSYVCTYVSTNNWTVVGYSNVGATLGKTTAALTTITIADAAGTPDYTLSALTTTLPYGLATAAEAITLLYVIKNLQDRVSQLETAAALIPHAL